MGVFDEVKERVTAREVMERAGIVFNRNNIDIVNIGLHFFHKDVRLYAASCSEV